MTYHLDIIDKNVIIPQNIDKEYNSIENAYSALEKFVHSFDGKLKVDGRVVCTDTDEDVEYCSSVMLSNNNNNNNNKIKQILRNDYQKTSTK